MAPENRSLARRAPLSGAAAASSSAVASAMVGGGHKKRKELERGLYGRHFLRVSCSSYSHGMEGLQVSQR
jgi:hypothetical protein